MMPRSTLDAPYDQAGRPLFTAVLGRWVSYGIWMMEGKEHARLFSGGARQMLIGISSLMAKEEGPIIHRAGNRPRNRMA